jgi:alanine racemase
VPVEGVRRPAWAEIDRAALIANVAALRAVCGAAAICGVVKANGYGHGAVAAAQALLDGGAAGLAVAIVDEGLELREAGVTAPILLLAETPANSVRDALEGRLVLTIGSREGAATAVREAAALGGQHRVHIKVDTGMHRMGVAPADLADVITTLQSTPTIVVEGLYTHFACADSDVPDDIAFTDLQMARFREAVDLVHERGLRPALLHAANSAGALGRPDARLSMVRVGLAAYGYLPHAGLRAALDERGLTLQPALSLHARVTAVRDLAAGERASYGRRRALPHAARVATVPFGYADGYPRRLFEAGASVLVHGRRFPLAGTVTMDQLVIDCGDEDVRVGDEVVLLGRQGEAVITADEWATWAGTITWEILCGIGARVPRLLV